MSSFYFVLFLARAGTSKNSVAVHTQPWPSEPHRRTLKTLPSRFTQRHINQSQPFCSPANIRTQISTQRSMAPILAEERPPRSCWLLTRRRRLSWSRTTQTWVRGSKALHWIECLLLLFATRRITLIFLAQRDTKVLSRCLSVFTWLDNFCLFVVSLFFIFTR